MKKILLALIFLSFTSISAYADPQQRGLLTGAAVGATAGALIGSQSNETIEGAVIGGVFGAIVGTLLSDVSAEPVYYGHGYHERPYYRDHERMENYHLRQARRHSGGYGYGYNRGHNAYSYNGYYRHHRSRAYRYDSHGYRYGRD